MNRIYLYILIFIVFLFTMTSLTGIFPISIKRATKMQGWDHKVYTQNLTNNSEWVIMEQDNGRVGLAIANKKFYGWKLTEAIHFGVNKKSANGYAGTESTINITNKRRIGYIIGIIIDNKIDKITISSGKILKEKPIKIITTKQGMRIYFGTFEKNLKDDLTTKAYSKKGKVLYTIVFPNL